MKTIQQLLRSKFGNTSTLEKYVTELAGTGPTISIFLATNLPDIPETMALQPPLYGCLRSHDSTHIFQNKHVISWHIMTEQFLPKDPQMKKNQHLDDSWCEFYVFYSFLIRFKKHRKSQIIRQRPTCPTIYRPVHSPTLGKWEKQPTSGHPVFAIIRI